MKDKKENINQEEVESEEKIEVSEKSDKNSESEKESQENLLDQINTLKDALLRKTAESENLRKRLEKEKDDAVKYANKNFARDLLAVLDNFERINGSIASVKDKIDADPNLKAYFDGIAICEKELLSTFQKYGVSRIEVSAGNPFNHELHQAMCEVENDQQPAGTVVKVFQTGYKYHDRLLRPVMVSVSKKK
ncbi:MAG: nucleotide exchange factor GrpE [Alphaproteobacteria bacterium]|nr:nucleotide exchange factor GrpE [Alphaproteobacteria bacterium]MBO7537592.1 nucleotide exchange factor GrpE [Alphaproteobacteria bacterium]MBO7641584.1 nucleotide exchange factor GrpE [Alphaproteobacteria bacterium]